MTRHLISQLAHVEIYTPRPMETVAFLGQQLGLEISATYGLSVYMRGWGESFHHSIKITEAEQPGLGHIGWRSDSEEDLEEAARILEESGRGEKWIDGDVGHGRAYQFRSPDGHLNEIFWMVERWQAPTHLQSAQRNRAQKYVPYGAAVRHLHHVTLNASDVLKCREFYQQNLGFKYREGIIDSNNISHEQWAFLSVTNNSHDLGLHAEPLDAQGRLHHLAFWLDTREEILRAADLLRDYDDHAIECGPNRHGVTEGFFVYVREPGGNRIGLFSGDAHIYAPDTEPAIWPGEENHLLYWGGSIPHSLSTYATPPVDMPPELTT